MSIIYAQRKKWTVLEWNLKKCNPIFLISIIGAILLGLILTHQDGFFTESYSVFIGGREGLESLFRELY